MVWRAPGARRAEGRNGGDALDAAFAHDAAAVSLCGLKA
jgi:hypothetical protein